jgi:hypothetical protein
MLTDLQAKKSKAAERDYKLADSGGLYLFVTTTGFKSWRLKYRFGGKEKRLVFGPYPEVSLSEARERRTGQNASYGARSTRRYRFSRLALLPPQTRRRHLRPSPGNGMPSKGAGGRRYTLMTS